MCILQLDDAVALHKICPKCVCERERQRGRVCVCTHCRLTMRLLRVQYCQCVCVCVCVSAGECACVFILQLDAAFALHKISQICICERAPERETDYCVNTTVQILQLDNEFVTHCR